MKAAYSAEDKAGDTIMGEKLSAEGEALIIDAGRAPADYDADAVIITSVLSRHAALKCSEIMADIDARGPGKKNAALVLFGCDEGGYDKRTIKDNYGGPAEVFVFPLSDIVMEYASAGKLGELIRKKIFLPAEAVVNFINSRASKRNTATENYEAKQAARPAFEAKQKQQVAERFYAQIDARRISGDIFSDPAGKEKIMAEMLCKIREIAAEVCGGGTPEHEATVKAVYQEVSGLGAIEDLLKDTEISEVMVNGHDRIYVESGGKIRLTEASYTDDASVIRAIQRIVMPLGRRIDESSPFVDARLPDGSRVNAIIPPLSVDGPVITIRKFSAKKLTAGDLVKFGSINEKMADYLESAVKQRKNILVSGGTGSGKTTLLNVLSGFIPEDERIVTIEDSAELKLSQKHVVRLESRPPNMEGRGEITIRELLKNSLRMRPDRIIVGECRGGEALDMLQAMNTGHEGSMTTVHANSPRDALSRIEVMALMSGVELPHRAVREQVKSAVDIIIQQSRLKDGSRKITAISEVTGMDGDMILMHDVFNIQNN